MSYFTLAADGKVIDESGLKTKDLYLVKKTTPKGSTPSNGTVYAGGNPDFDESTGQPKIPEKELEFGHHKNSYYRGYLIFFDKTMNQYKVLDEILDSSGRPNLAAVFFRYFPSVGEARAAIDEKIVQDTIQQSSAPETVPEIPPTSKMTAGKKLAVGGGLLATALFLLK